MNLTGARRAAAVLAATGALIAFGAGIASAATPTIAHPSTATPLGTSEGLHLSNSSFDSLVLTSVSGKNEGVPTVGSVLQPGTGIQDFEVTMRAAKTTTVTADYNVMDPSDNQIGTAKLTFSLDALGVPSAGGSFTATNGAKLPLNVQNDGGVSLKDFQVVGNGSTTTLDAADPLAKTLVDQYCAQKISGATCSYNPTSRTGDSAMNLLAMSYNPTGGDNEPVTLSVASGYMASTTDSWADTFSVQAELANVFSIGIEGTYGQSVTWQSSYSTSESVPIDPGYTGYIWGEVPQIQYTGTMKVTMGTTTYDIQNATLTEPDPTKTLTGFSTATRAGDDPLNSPSSPPAGAMRLS